MSIVQNWLKEVQRGYADFWWATSKTGTVEDKLAKVRELVSTVYMKS